MTPRAAAQRLANGEEGFALATVILLSIILTTMLVGLSVLTLANLGSSTRSVRTAEARGLAEAALDDVYGRMVARQVATRSAPGALGYLEDRDPSNPAAISCGESDTALSCLGVHPALFTPEGNAPTDSAAWRTFDASGALAPCPGLNANCFYLKHAVVDVANNTTFDADRRLGGAREILLQVTVRTNCRGEEQRCEYLRFQQTLRERRFTDYLSLTQREVIDPYISGLIKPDTSGLGEESMWPSPGTCPEWPLGASVPPGGGWDAEADGAGSTVVPDANVRAEWDEIFEGCLEVPYIGLDTFICGPSGCAPSEPAYSVEVSGPGRVVLPTTPGGNPFVDAFTTGSIEVWFTTDDVTARQVLFEQGSSANGMNLYLADGILYGGVWSTAFPEGLLTEAPVKAGDIHHAVLTFDGTQGIARLYLNGAEATRAVRPDAAAGVGADAEGGALGSVVGSTVMLDQGTAPVNAGEFAGRLDEVARYPGVLGADRVAAHHAARQQAASTYVPLIIADGPQVYYRLEEPSGSTTAENTALGGGLAGTFESVTLGTAPLAATGTQPQQDLTGRDIVDGPVHTNDEYVYICAGVTPDARPEFLDVVETASGLTAAPPDAGCASGEASFAVPPRVGPQLALPQSAGEVAELADRYRSLAGVTAAQWSFGLSPGCTLASEIEIRLAGPNIVVSSPCDGVAATKSLPPSGVVYARGTVRLSDAEGNTCGVRQGSGLSGRLTVVGHGNLHVTGNLTYCSDTNPLDGELPDGATDLLGLVALPWTNGEIYAEANDCTVTPVPAACINSSTANTTGAIRLPNTTTAEYESSYAPITLQAVLAAPNRTVYVESTSDQIDREPPPLVVHGALIAKYRPIFSTYEDGTFTSGVLKDITYDSRLRTTQPPYMVQPTASSWERVDLIEVPGKAVGL